jgi:PEP-CTERM/exosortase A-associated glycosyltransferase
MKILHVLDHSLPLHSGYTFRSQNIFRAQQDFGWEPVILTSPKHEESWKGERRTMERINGFTYYRTGNAAGRAPIEREVRLMYALYRRIREVAAREKPDILHAHSPVLNAVPALRAGRKLGLPVVYEIRAFWEDAAVDHGTYAENSWKYKMVRNLETWACRRADHVTILCNGLKQDLIDRGIRAGKITPVFNGVNPEDFTPRPPDEAYVREWGLAEKRVIGFIGSFYRYEGLDLLVAAFARLTDRYPDAVLLLVGGGEMRDELAAQVRNLGIANRVIMPGRIPHERIAGVYAMVDILAYPRYSMRLTELVTPLKPLEAMAMGKALVASAVGGHRELIRNNETGILFEAGNVKSLAYAVDQLLSNREKLDQLKDNGYQWVREHHTWAMTTAPYRGIYKKLMSRGMENG